MLCIMYIFGWCWMAYIRTEKKNGGKPWKTQVDDKNGAALLPSDNYITTTFFSVAYYHIMVIQLQSTFWFINKLVVIPKLVRCSSFIYLQKKASKFSKFVAAHRCLSIVQNKYCLENVPIFTKHVKQKWKKPPLAIHSTWYGATLDSVTQFQPVSFVPNCMWWDGMWNLICIW